MTAVDAVEIRKAPEPELDPEGAILHVEACGICGTDARTFFNGDPRAPAPWVLGHEPVGILEQVGPAAVLPPGVKEDDIHAGYKDGILEVRIPVGKEEKPESKRIAITRD